jgi:predicted protein tyrosine phosphatase
MWIQNVSLSDITKGHHIDCGPNSMLIQIVDHDMSFPKALYQFKETHQFKFLDVEEIEGGEAKYGPKEHHAKALVELLQHAKKNRMNVLVHCVAGICRSGAVCEVGVMMGFQDSKSFRIPNLLLKKLMMQQLGWTYF